MHWSVAEVDRRGTSPFCGAKAQRPYFPGKTTPQAEHKKHYRTLEVGANVGLPASWSLCFGVRLLSVTPRDRLVAGCSRTLKSRLEIASEWRSTIQSQGVLTPPTEVCQAIEKTVQE